MAIKIQKYGFFAECIIHIVYLVSKFALKKVDHYFLDGNPRRLDLPYPTVYIANHVSELDIPGLATIHKRIQNPRIQYTIPVREDIVQKNFLVKEFRPKGILKYILHLIDLTGILPLLFRIVGAVPVKRPFRDNARAMVKDGSLRDQVDKDWTILSDNIDLGKNVVVFPEGVFSEDGNLRVIKNGIAHLSEKKPGLNYFYFNFTYDLLSDKKPCLHIGFGELFQINPASKKEEITSMIKEKLSRAYVVNSANLVSFLILSSDLFVGKDKIWIQKSVTDLAKKIHDKENAMVENALLDSQTETIDRILSVMVKRKLISFSKEGIYAKGPKWEIENNPEKPKSYRKDKPFTYHKNQLRAFEPTLLNSISEYK